MQLGFRKAWFSISSCSFTSIVPEYLYLLPSASKLLTSIEDQPTSNYEKKHLTNWYWNIRMINQNGSVISYEHFRWPSASPYIKNKIINNQQINTYLLWYHCIFSNKWEEQLYDILRLSFWYKAARHKMQSLSECTRNFEKLFILLEVI